MKIIATDCVPSNRSFANFCIMQARNPNASRNPRPFPRSENAFRMKNKSAKLILLEQADINAVEEECQYTCSRNGVRPKPGSDRQDEEFQMLLERSIRRRSRELYLIWSIAHITKYPVHTKLCHVLLGNRAYLFQKPVAAIARRELPSDGHLHQKGVNTRAGNWISIPRKQSASSFLLVLHNDVCNERNSTTNNTGFSKRGSVTYRIVCNEIEPTAHRSVDNERNSAIQEKYVQISYMKSTYSTRFILKMAKSALVWSVITCHFEHKLII